MYTFTAILPETPQDSESSRKISPSPWTYELVNKFWFAVKDSEGRVISSVWHEREADALLIAAAPLMLKTLKKVRNELDNLFYAAEVEHKNFYGPNESLMGEVQDLIALVTNLDSAIADRLEKEAALAAEQEAAAARSDPKLAACFETWRDDIDTAWAEYLRLDERIDSSPSEIEASLIHEEHPFQSDDIIDFGD